MKIDTNDSRITAFALGELKGEDAIEIARAVQSEACIREAVDEVRETSFMLLESLNGGEAPMLTPAQRETVRRAGGGPIIADISSTPVWRKSLIAGGGIAAAIALTLYMMGGRSVIQETDRSAGVDEVKSGWDWSQVDVRDLIAPVEWRVKKDASDEVTMESTRAVAAALRDDTLSFRREVDKRIRQSDLRLASQLPENQENDWLDVSSAMRLDVPMVSGAASWPWLQRYVEDKGALPPQQAVRIEEMLNHFQYKTPDMLTGDTLTGDMEICHTAWNTETSLLALHIAARPDAISGETTASISFNSERVRRVRLLGYTQVHDVSPTRSSVLNGCQISKSRGNYILYELELTGLSESQEAIATLVLNEGAQLEQNRIGRWEDVSSDMRFASLVAATGMMLSGHQSLGDLDAYSLQKMVQAVEKQDESTMIAARRDAIDLINKVITISKKSLGGEKEE